MESKLVPDVTVNAKLVKKVPPIVSPATLANTSFKENAKNVTLFVSLAVGLSQLTVSPVKMAGF
jgi:hypothetical protein